MTRIRQPKPVFREFEIEKLNPAAFNPTDRVKPSGLRPLILAIKAVGSIMYPLLVTHATTDGYADIVDGHRRHAAAKIMGYSHLWCLVYSYDQAVAWAAANGGTKNINGRSWTNSVAGGLPLEIVPSAHRSDIAKAQRVLGETGFKMLAGNNFSASLVTEAQALLKIAGMPTDDWYLAETARWMIRHNLQRRARTIREHFKLYDENGYTVARAGLCQQLATAIQTGKSVYYDGEQWQVG